MMRFKYPIGAVLIAFNLLLASLVPGQEVFIGNPGKSLNFFHFDLAIERGFFKELGLDVKLLNTKCLAFQKADVLRRRAAGDNIRR